MATPWLLSNAFIEAVKRKFSVPVAQNLLSDNDILAFANEEMMISQVPSILQFHEEFFVFSEDILLENNKSRYQIPPRAIGGRLRDVFYRDRPENMPDVVGNLFEMTRVNSDDKAFYQRGDAGINSYISKYYLENNYIVLSPNRITNPIGYLNVTYFLRPNQLVKDELAAISNAFGKQITIDNTTLVAGDTFTISPNPNGTEDIIFTAVVASPGPLEFAIGGTSIISATNLVNAINLDDTYEATNGNPSTAIVTIDYPILRTTFTTTNELAFVVSTDQGIKFNIIPDNIENGSIIDFLQTRPGHKTHKFGVVIPDNAISDVYIYFTEDQVPEEFEVGDYICNENECIIPQIPTDLHISLVERTGNRIMSAIGDQQALEASNQKLGEIESRQGTLIDNRVEGSCAKVVARHSLLAFGKMGIRRRL